MTGATGTQTPRTNAEVTTVEAGEYPGEHPRVEVVSAKLSRQLERELTLAKEALGAVASRGCQSFTSGIGACYKQGRIENHEYGAKRVCDACQSQRALSELERLKGTT